MAEIVTLKVPSRIAPQADRLSALAHCFAETRRRGDDVFWLKENAELLNILESTGMAVPQSFLENYEGFYAQAEKRLRFFPQYYRFLLSLALDIEALGMPGDTAAAMVAWAADEGLAEAELSDLQRAEARRLMARRGVDPIRDAGLDDRLRRFASRTATFALPNKKAAYELTHIVFYLSEYGRLDPQVGGEIRRSLHFAGLTAFLDQNADLLAEICIALRFAGETPPPLWTDWLMRETARFAVESGPAVSVADDYHCFFVCNWHAAVEGAEIFRKPLSAERMRFDRPRSQTAALREVSEAMLQLDAQRSGDWARMRRTLSPCLSEEARDVLEMAAGSSAHFEAYFEGFARAGGQ
ncbi:MAG: hypothetical protein QNJ09_02810 [Paracoccaceae bacterium]|nr:hypothetical protein [Paracoccaceae bacterium]